MTDCYYRRLGADGDVAVFESTDHTRSNWTPEIQHGSPPLALMTKVIEEQLRPGMRIGRMTLDILGAIPVAEVRVRARVDRPGSRISLLSAEMSADRPTVGRASRRGRSRPSDTADVATDRFPPMVEGETAPLALHWKDAGGYLDSVQWRPQFEPAAGAAVYWLTPVGAAGRRRTDSPRCSAWRWWSTPPMALAPRSIRASSCS